MENHIAEAIDRIVELTKKSVEKENAVIMVDGKPYWLKNQSRIFEDYRPVMISVSSLSALVDYVKENREGIDVATLFIHVATPRFVYLYEKFSGEMKIRSIFMTAGLDNDVDTFAFGRFVPQEQFIIGIMSLFEGSEDRDLVVKVAGNLISEKKFKGEDDGVTMKYQATAGVICTLQDVPTPEVVRLAPFRTFWQVEQPDSPFIFRYRDSGDGVVTCALIEADGGAWKHTAMENIQEYFRKNLPEVQVIA